MVRANTIGRASGDPRRFERRGAVVREWSAAVFGRDILDFEVTPNGFAPPMVTKNTSRRHGRTEHRADRPDVGGATHRTPAHVHRVIPSPNLANP